MIAQNFVLGLNNVFLFWTNKAFAIHFYYSTVWCFLITLGPFLSIFLRTLGPFLARLPLKKISLLCYLFLLFYCCKYWRIIKIKLILFFSIQFKGKYSVQCFSLFSSKGNIQFNVCYFLSLIWMKTYSRALHYLSL